MPTPRKSPMPDPQLMAQWRPTMVPPPMPPMPPGGMGQKPPTTNVSLRLGSQDMQSVPPQAKSAIIMEMLKKLLGSGGGMPPGMPPATPGAPGAPGLGIPAPNVPQLPTA